ncbi:MAG TPA: Xaa-Pro peptidase family protein [Desulfomonilaceae bacterium]|nr:Xaa-Pro peptidase family protein [Desulfomonilaceae bacterium]
MPSIPSEEIHRRIAALQKAMAANGFDGALIVQRVDLYYFSGTGQDAHLFVPTVGKPKLMVRKSFERATEESPLDLIIPLNGFSGLRKAVEEVHGPLKCLGMELDVLPVNLFRIYEQLFAGAEIKDCSVLIKEVRMVKSSYELDLMRQAARLNDAMFAQVRQILKEGLTEAEFAGQLEAFYRKHGHQGLVRVRTFNHEIFYGHIMSGTNLAVPSASVGPTGGPGLNPSFPSGGGLKVIKRHEPVSVDYVAVIEGYLADVTRLFFIGEPPEKFVKIHAVALSIQQAIMSAGVPGAPTEALYDIAVRIAQDAGLEEGFMGYPQPVPFVGHGIGLELDELPLLGRKSPHALEKGMVVAVEPKFIIPAEGMAGVENSFVVTSKGLEKLSLFDDEIQVLP